MRNVHVLIALSLSLSSILVEYCILVLLYLIDRSLRLLDLMDSKSPIFVVRIEMFGK